MALGPRHEVFKLEATNPFAAGDTQAGITALENALDLYPFDQEARRQLCDQRAASGSIRDVIQCLDEWISYTPRFADGYFLRAQYLEKLGRFREALDSLEAGLGIAPNFEPAMKHRERLLNRLR